VFPQDVYFIDLGMVYSFVAKNIWYVMKLLMVSYMLFVWLPTKIFPQSQTVSSVQKLTFNFIYMSAYIELVIPLLVFVKIFSLIFFLVVLVGTRLAFEKFYYHRSIRELVHNLRVKLMLKSLDILDDPQGFKQQVISNIKEKILLIESRISFFTLSKKVLFYSVFTYILSILITRGLMSYSDPVSDTAQFMEWVNYLQHNNLYADNKTFGADFYGISIMIFFINVFTNIDPIILFSLYPLLLLIALYISIYYVIKDFSDSKYTALFGVILHGLIFMSPMSNLLIGEIVTTANPHIVDFFNMKFYMPSLQEVKTQGHLEGYYTYIRYVSGMAYEHASVFVLLNAYFLIKVFKTQLLKYLILYSLTLMLVFIFHGGGAIVLIFISMLIALNALLFMKLNWRLLTRGTIAIIFAAIFGNLWILSMIKYGIPQDFGAAAPILDKLLGTQKNVENIAKTGFSIVSIINISKFHLLMFASLAFAFIIAFFSKKRFLNTSYLLIILGVFLIYFGPNAGLPLLTKQGRLIEYLFFAMTLLGAFYFHYLIQKPFISIFKKYANSVLLFLMYLIFLFLVLSTPRWIDTEEFWKNINQTQYTSIPEIIMKIDKENRPYSWTAVAYIQTYAKILDKGYHINTQNLILDYSPAEKYLAIPTEKIYIFVENYPNAYKGMEEWFYRWREKFQTQLKSWIAIYQMTHDNMRVYYKTKTVTVYSIDNRNYIQYLRDKKKEKE